MRRGGGFLEKYRRRRGTEVAVELTPLIDITFQLLIFFLLTATFQQQSPSFKVKLPKASNRDRARDAKAVVVAISKDGRLQVDGKEVDDRELELRLCAAVERGRPSVNIKADADTPHRFVVRVMDVAKRCKMEKLGILHGS